MTPVQLAAAEHVAALGPALALASIRRGAPADARAHLADVLGHAPTIRERRELVSAIRSAARDKAQALIEEASGYEDQDYIGIDVEELQIALRADDEAEPFYECDACQDAGTLVFLDEEGMPEREACRCTFVRKAAA